MAQSVRFIDRVKDRSAKVGIVGLGYVGLPMARLCAKRGFEVIGVDSDRERIESIERDGSAEGVRTTTDHSMLSTADVILICVATPLKGREPDLGQVAEATKQIRSALRPGMLVVLESTSYPGTTEGFIREELERDSLKAGIDFWLACSPERLDPGNRDFDLARIPKVVAGLTNECAAVATAFYQEIVETVHVAPRPREAELAKLLENTYRQVNIALANEFAMVARELDIDIWATIEAASTKPFGYEPFWPGVGTGGHCIAVDPVYLAWRIRELGRSPFRLVELAREIDDAMPLYVSNRIVVALDERDVEIAKASIFVLGLTYKPDVADLRESRSLDVAELLHKMGASILWHDPFHESVDLLGWESARSSLDEIARCDATVILTPHSSYAWETIVRASRLVFDARGVTRGIESDKIVLL